MQDLKQHSSVSANLERRTIETNFVHPLIEPLPNLLRVLGCLISASSVQLEKASLLIDETDDLIETFLCEIRSLKQLFSIVTNEESIVISDNFGHPLKASLPILVTDNGNDIFLSDVLFSKQLSSIVSNEDLSFFRS